MFDDIIKSVKAHLYERTTSPLLGSIIISWIIINFRFVMLLFSSASIKQKYYILDTVLFPTWQQIGLKGFLFPLLIGLFYIFIYPYPAKFVYEFSRKRQKEISDIKMEIEGKTLLTITESQNIRSEFYKLQEKYQQDIRRKDEEIQLLKEENNSKGALNKNDIAELNKRAKNADNAEKESSKDQEILLVALGKMKGKVNESTILNESKSDHNTIKFNLQELVNNGYLKRFYDSNGRIKYGLEHKGRSFLVKKTPE